MTGADAYAGPFDPDFRLSRLSRAALARLGRETMLFAHLHDRALMPLVGARLGAEAMTDVACDEWMGASPVYNRRLRDRLGIGGDGVSAILKTLQLDVGFPHQYMDVRYELEDEGRGYFWLPFCGAFQDVSAHAGGRREPIVQLCHHMEDTTFDATVSAVNPRARCTPVHRPPLAEGHTGPTCRWQVAIGEQAVAPVELDLTREIRRSRAAAYVHGPAGGCASGADAEDGMTSYAGPFRPDFALEDLARPVLAWLCDEFALDVHLLMRAAFRSLRARFGPEVSEDLLREHRAALAPVSVPRLRAALGIGGDDVASILKTLQVDPALPGGYVATGARLDAPDRGLFWIEDCAALAPGEPEAWLALLADPESPGLDATLAAVNPRARCRPVAPERVEAAGAVRLAWEIRIDPEAAPRQEPSMTRAVRASNAAGFRFR